jgi:triosephosphate isomerase
MTNTKMIFVNFKTYVESSGANAERLAAFVSSLSLQYPVPLIACVQGYDLDTVSELLPDTTWVQHVDCDEIGKATGKQLPEYALIHNATGTLLNHSAHKLDFETLTQTVKRCKDLDLPTLVFASDLEEAKKVATLNPDYIGYEPPEFISSTETSVAKEEPEIIKRVVDAIPNIPIIVGAGVKDQNDVRVCLELGAKGIAIAHGVIFGEDPKAVLEDLAKGFGKWVR